MSNVNLYREQLPGADLEVSNVAFGTYKLGMKLDAAAAVDLIGRAYHDHGINMIDTSDNYPNAIEYIGSALGQDIFPRDEIVIASKSGLATSQEEANRFARAGRRADLSPDRIRRNLEASLKVLGTDYMDLYQAHTYDPKVSPADLAYTMTELICEGKIRYWGVCNYTKAQLQELLDTCMATGLIKPVTYQQYQNMADRPFEDDVKHAKSKGLGVLAFSPLAKGALTSEYAVGYYNQQRASFEMSLRTNRSMSQHDKELYEQAHGLFRLHEVAKDQGYSLQQLAVAWSLGNPNTDVTLLGAYNKGHLDELMQATSLTLDDDLQKRADALAKELARMLKG